MTFSFWKKNLAQGRQGQTKVFTIVVFFFFCFSLNTLFRLPQFPGIIESLLAEGEMKRHLYASIPIL